jgi:hypothetical protein
MLSSDHITPVSMQLTGIHEHIGLNTRGSTREDCTGKSCDASDAPNASQLKHSIMLSVQWLSCAYPLLPVQSSLAQLHKE